MWLPSWNPGTVSWSSSFSLNSHRCHMPKWPGAWGLPQDPLGSFAGVVWTNYARRWWSTASTGREMSRMRDRPAGCCALKPWMDFLGRQVAPVQFQWIDVRQLMRDHIFLHDPLREH